MSATGGGCLQSTGHSVQPSACREGRVAGAVSTGAWGAKPAALTCLWSLDWRHCPITTPAVAREVPSQNTQHTLNTVAGGRKWQRKQGPQSTAAISDSSSTSTALLWGQRDHPQLPKLSPAGLEPAQTPCPSSTPHAEGTAGKAPCCSAARQLSHALAGATTSAAPQEQPQPMVSSCCKEGCSRAQTLSSVPKMNWKHLAVLLLVGNDAAPSQAQM